MVLLGTLAAGAESISRRAAQALGRGEDLRMAMSEPEVQSRLRTALHNERSTHLRSYGTTHAPQVGPKLTSQTVFSGSLDTGLAIVIDNPVNLRGSLDAL